MKRLLALVLLIPTLVISAVAVGSRDSNQSDYAGVHFSFCANSSTILFNGEKRDFYNTPFIEAGVFYVPLREVVESCGGIVKYIPHNRSVVVALPQMGASTQPSFSQLWIDTGEIICDNGVREVLPSIADKGIGVLLKNNTTFVSLDYFFRIHFAAFVTSEDQAILYNIPYRAGIGPFNIEQDFNQLSSEIQSEFYMTGDASIDENDPTAQREIWTNGVVSLTLMSNSRYFPEDTRTIMRIEVTKSSYPTDWGLEVGDSEEKYHNLYLSLQGFFIPEISDGKIAKLVYVSFH